MENASKALIIAGAILLAILLISLGIMIFNQAQDTVSNSGMSEAQITAFNNKFLKYEGNQKGTMVKSMIQEVLATNANQDVNGGLTVTVTFTGTNAPASGTTPSTSKIINKNSYSVKLDYSDGRVNKITIDGTFSS